MRGISMRENREARRSPVGADAVPPSWIAGWQVGVRAGREGKAVELLAGQRLVGEVVRFVAEAGRRAGCTDR